MDTSTLIKLNYELILTPIQMQIKDYVYIVSSVSFFFS
jgi:hypothetical protein